MAANNILDILTKVDRPHFTIDGASYEMRHPTELSMTEFHLLSTMGSKLIKLSDQYKSDPEGAFKAIRRCMGELLEMVTPGLPTEVRDKLNPFHVQQILDSFIGLSRIEPKPDVQPTPKKSSPGSAASTADSHKTG